MASRQRSPEVLAQRILERVKAESLFVEKSGYTLETLRLVLASELRGQKHPLLVQSVSQARNRLGEYLNEFPEHDQADLRLWEAHEILGKALIV